MTSAVLIVPAAMLDAANAVGASWGWGPKNFTIPLSADGLAVTHWGSRFDPTQADIDRLESAPDIETHLDDELTGHVHLAAVMAARELVQI